MSLERLQADLNKFIRGSSNAVAKDLAPMLLREIHKSPDFPVKSGKLRRGGFAYVEGGLAARTGGITYPPRISRKEDRVTVLFTAPKAATKGATVYYTEGGQRLFDYAAHVHEGGFYEHTYTARKYVETFMNMLTWRPIITLALRKLWSKKR